MSGVGCLNLKVVNFKQTHLSNAPKILGDGIGTMNYVDVRIAFQRATEAALEALRRESKQQVREALSNIGSLGNDCVLLRPLQLAIGDL